MSAARGCRMQNAECRTSPTDGGGAADTRAREFRHACRVWAVSAFFILHSAFSLAGPSLDAAIATAQERTVKLYGAQFGKQQGYGSGVVVSEDGFIVTALASLLESPSLRAVLHDGRRYPATIVARDTQRQLALLKIDASALAHFELGSSEHLVPGDWVIAAANPFKVAEGPEDVSVAVGVLSGRAEFAARHRAQDFPYAGQVLLTDIVVATPGSAGGALVDADGKLVGVIGKMVESTRTNTLVNYAMPVEEVAGFVRRAQAGEADDAQHATATSQPSGTRMLQLGIRLLDYGSRSQPPYVERVRPDSAAAIAGLRNGDLILSIAGSAMQTCTDVRTALDRTANAALIVLVVKRGDEVKNIEIRAEGAR